MTNNLSISGQPLLSRRTANYVAALLRQGDAFDHSKWLREVRGEEASPKSNSVTCNPSELIATEAGTAMNSPSAVGAVSNSGPALHRVMPKAVWRSTADSADNAAKPHVTRRLEKVCDAWAEFQASRVRNAVYGYLEAVFAAVIHYKVRRKNKLLRNAFKFAGLPFDGNADPFSAVIRCTCGRNADGKTISKWARALPYVAHCNVRAMELEAFMKEVGGVNACADRYAEYLGRGAR
jgi:hypothetical protein